MITSKQLVAYALSWLNAPYMYGVNGDVITETLIQAKAKQYPDKYDDPKKIERLRQNIGKRAVQCNTFTSVMLGVQRSADGWLKVATASGPIAEIPDIVGITVHYPGHMGIYIGGGKVVEARGTFYGVVITKVMDRPWKNWAKMPGVDYTEGDETVLKVGDEGDQVKIWQQSLLYAGYALVNKSGTKTGADGDFGTGTENGTKDFQKNHNLPVTGSVDLETQSAMLAKLLTIAIDRVPKSEIDRIQAIIKSGISILQKGV